MEYRRVGYAIVFVILLCALAKWNSEQKLGPPPVNMAWNHSRKELVDRKKAIGDDSYMIKEETVKSSNSILLKKSVLKDFEVLPPQMKLTVLNCLNKNRASSANWFIGCPELRFDRDDTPRRYLASKSDQNPKHNLPAPMHTYSQHFHATPPKPISIQPTTIYPSAVPSDFKLPPLSPMVTVEHTQENSGSDMIELVTIVVAAVVVVIVLVAVILLCCMTKREGENGSVQAGKRDERSSFALNRSTTNQAPGLGNDSNDEMDLDEERAFSSRNIELGSNSRSLASGASLAEHIPSLKLPPGKDVVGTEEAPSAPPPPPPTGPPAPPPPRPQGNAPPPPPPKGSRAPQPPKKIGQKGAGPGHSDDGAHKAKLKPFFWDKVAANPNRSMVWNEISTGSFQFNEEMMESLFGANANQNKQQKKEHVPEPTVQYIQLIDKKKAQNLSILLKALSVTTKEICDALTEGNELPVELVSTLLKMAPTQEEEMKLKLYDGDIAQLGPAEQFLKALVSIPFAFKRLECLLFLCNLQEETAGVKESFATLEVASNKLKKSRLFLKLLEAVLKTGNRMNDGTYRGGAMAFKLDTLLKLSDVKGTDGKTTLLHFVVQEIIRFEGSKAARQESLSHRSVSSVKTEDLDEDFGGDTGEHDKKLGLEVVSGLSNELEDVKKAALIDANSLTYTLSQLGQSLMKSKEFLKSQTENTGDKSVTDEFSVTLGNFLERAEVEIKQLLEEDKRIMALVKSAADYFHGSSGKDEGLRLFTIVRNFLRILDNVCNQIKEQQKISAAKSLKKEASAASASQMQKRASDRRRRLFPDMRDRHAEGESSSDGYKDSKLKKDDGSNSDDESNDSSSDESKISRDNKNSSSAINSSQLLQQSLDRQRHLFSHIADIPMDDESSSDEFESSSSKKYASPVSTSSQIRLHSSDDHGGMSPRVNGRHIDEESSFEDKEDEHSVSKKDSSSEPTSSQIKNPESDDKSSSDDNESKISQPDKNSSLISEPSQMLQKSLEHHRSLLTGRHNKSSSDEKEYKDFSTDEEEKLPH